MIFEIYIKKVLHNMIMKDFLSIYRRSRGMFFIYTQEYNIWTTLER